MLKSIERFFQKLAQKKALSQNKTFNQQMRYEL